MGWLRGDYGRVVTTEILGQDATRLQAEVLKLRRHIRMLAAIVRLLVALLRALDVRLDGTRLPDSAAKTRLLRAIDAAQSARSLRSALRLSPSRHHQWRRAEQACEIDDRVSCPQSTPTRLTAAETLTMKEMPAGSRAGLASAAHPGPPRKARGWTSGPHAG